MIAPLFLRPGVHPTVVLRKNPLPAPVFRRIGVLPIKGVRTLNPAPLIRHILLIHSLDLREVALQGNLRPCGAGTGATDSYAEPVALSSRTHRVPN